MDVMDGILVAICVVSVVFELLVIAFMLSEK